jgi:hypothetical protein
MTKPNETWPFPSSAPPEQQNAPDPERVTGGAEEADEGGKAGKDENAAGHLKDPDE